MNTGRFEQFLQYLSKEVIPATKDLEKLADENRKHVQKLVFTNLVDRFDATIDGTLLDNCRLGHLTAEALKPMTQQITESELLTLLMRSNGLQEAVDERLKLSLRNSVLRQRHSKKLATLFAAFGSEDTYFNKPRVNVNTGAILQTMRPQNSSVPHSICGYADWLYSRRNAIVHGAGTVKLLSNDIEQLKKIYKCSPVSGFRIKLASTTIAAKFYESVVALLQKASDQENS